MKLTSSEKEMYLLFCGWTMEEHKTILDKYIVYTPPDGHPFTKTYRYTLSLDRAFRSQKRVDYVRSH
jgi:hypothetical protein